MDWGAVLSGIGGAAEGASQGFSWEQGRRDKRANDEADREAIRQRDERLAELQRMLETLRQDGDTKERTAAQQAKDAETAREQAEADRYIASLPSHLQEPARGKRYGLTLDAEDFVPPKTPEQLAADAQTKTTSVLDQLKREAQIRADVEVNTHGRKKQIDHRYGRLPITPSDDPTIPRGVQDYLVQLRTKHPTFEAAAGELSSLLPKLRADHPSLSSTKALNALRQSFTGGGAADDNIDALAREAAQGVVTGAPTGGRGGGSARAAAPGPASAMTRSAAHHTVTVAELTALAAKRGTTLEQETARATAAGFIVR